MSSHKQKILYLDMDGVLADFEAKAKTLTPEELAAVNGLPQHIPRFYLDLPLIPGAKEAVPFLQKHFDVYVLSTAPWDNPFAWMDKRIWLEKHFPSLKRRLILSHHKNLLCGDYLIDDRTVRGAAEFPGEHIHFSTARFPHWDAVLSYLREKEQLHETL